MVKENPRLSTVVRDEAIRTAWFEIEAADPWSVDRFINELSGFTDDKLLNSITESKYETMEVLR